MVLYINNELHLVVFDFVIVSQVFMVLLNLIDPQDPGRFIACISNKEKERRDSCSFIAFACIAS